MRDIYLSGGQWTSTDDFCHDLLNALGAPPRHGRNLDALWDSITSGDINGVNPPFKICIEGADTMLPACKLMVDRFLMVIFHAKAKGYPVEALYV